MNTAAAHQAFDDLIKAVQADKIPKEINLIATPVIAATYPGESINVRQKPMPAGTVPDEPDSLAVQIRISGGPGTMVGAEVLRIAAAHGLRLAGSDTLLT